MAEQFRRQVGLDTTSLGDGVKEDVDIKQMGNMHLCHGGAQDVSKRVCLGIVTMWFPFLICCFHTAGLVEEVT
eukprot:5463613-Amphidinium_carterae.1